MRFDAENMTFSNVCFYCGTENTHDISTFSPQFNEEFQQWENLNLLCPKCEENGMSNTSVININIPIISDMEVEVMEDLASAEERTARNEIRKLIWLKLPSLQGLDRAALEAEFAEENAAELAAIREQIARSENEQETEAVD